jgi:OOP family OmpA-OmpF porin
MKLKTSAIAILAALPMLASAAAPTAAQLQDRVFGSVVYEGYFPDADKTESAEWANQDKGDGLGFNVGYRISPEWSIRAEYVRQSLDSLVANAKDVEGNRVGLDLGYHLPNTPYYLLGGVKNFTTGRSASALNLGVGANWFVQDNLALFAEANRYQGISKSFADAAIKVGATYFFGDAPANEPTPAPVVAPQPVVGDADKDGVTDDKDQCANTPITDKVDTVGCSIFTENSVSIALNAQFDNDSSVVKTQYHADIEKLANFLKRFPNTDVEIGGHASNVGTPAYNLALSQRRAEAIAETLVTQFGIDRARVKAVGYGITKPKASGKTAAAHALNRRIEATVTATVKEAVQR